MDWRLLILLNCSLKRRNCHFVFGEYCLMANVRFGSFHNCNTVLVDYYSFSFLCLLWSNTIISYIFMQTYKRSYEMLLLFNICVVLLRIRYRWWCLRVRIVHFRVWAYLWVVFFVPNSLVPTFLVYPFFSLYILFLLVLSLHWAFLQPGCALNSLLVPLNRSYPRRTLYKLSLHLILLLPLPIYPQYLSEFTFHLPLCWLFASAATRLHLLHNLSFVRFCLPFVFSTWMRYLIFLLVYHNPPQCRRWWKNSHEWVTILFCVCFWVWV